MNERPGVASVDEQVDVPVDTARWARLVELVLELEQVPANAEVSLLFVGEPEIGELNERYLGGHGPTDVLAFPLDGEHIAQARESNASSDARRRRADEPPLALGDVVVCPAVAARQSRERGATVESELALLVVHGTLHLLGYDHARESDAARMQARESRIVSEFERLDHVGEGV